MNIDNEEVRECTNKNHSSQGSEYPKNAVSVTKFINTKSNILFKTCWDCRNYARQYTRQYHKSRSEKLKILVTETNKLESDILCCTNVQHSSNGSDYKQNEVPIELFRKEPGNIKSELFKTCKNCRDRKIKHDKSKSEKLKILVAETNELGSDILCCTNLSHSSNGSDYKQNEVPIELFRKEPGNIESELFKTCKNCRDQNSKFRKIISEKLNNLVIETNNLGCDTLCCTNVSHPSSDSNYKQNEVPIELFRKEPGNIKSELFKMCKNCRDTANASKMIRVNNKVSTAIQKDMFFCKVCYKEKDSSCIAVNLNGSESSMCVDCKALSKQRSEQYKVKYHDFKIEIIEKNECSCLICKKIYLKDRENNQAIEIETFMIDDVRYIRYNDKNHTCKDFINDYKYDLEILILQFDHLSENEQRKRGLLLPHEEYVYKKYDVSRARSESALRLEALKCQLICTRCHVIETIRREKDEKGDNIRQRIYKNKMDFTNKSKEKGCENCKYKNLNLPRFFHFDHIDPNNKIIDVARMVQDYDYTLKDVIYEINKCRVLCQHCHIIHTYNQFNNGVLLDKIHKNIIF